MHRTGLSGAATRMKLQGWLEKFPINNRMASKKFNGQKRNGIQGIYLGGVNSQRLHKMSIYLNVLALILKSPQGQLLEFGFRRN
jgi:hypothetical protein